MMINSNALPLISTDAISQLPEMAWFMLIPLISWLTGLGVFCKSSDLEKLRASIAERYMRARFTPNTRRASTPKQAR
jgi:hypothetical protein